MHHAFNIVPCFVNATFYIFNIKESTIYLGKKGKKKKNCKTVDLMSFLADGGGTPTIPLKSTSWADDVEDEHGMWIL